MGRIFVVGSLNMDIVAVTPRIPMPGETLTGSDHFMTPGGKGANQAYAAARLGGDVAMFGRVGADDIGARLVANLAEVGCDVTRVAVVEGGSGVAMIVVADDGLNSIVVVPGANARFTPEDVAAADLTIGAGDVLLLQLETPIDTVTAMARYARAQGATVILDPAPVPAAALPSALLAHVDILTPNEVEARGLLGLGGHSISTGEAEPLARRLRSLGVERIVLKLGAAGCLVLDGDAADWIEAPAVRAIDSTAAGDTFNGALAVGLTEGESLAGACRLSVAAASLSVTKRGAQASMPDRNAVMAQLSR